MRSSRVLHMVAASAFAGLFGAGCASAPSTGSGASLWYSCCATDVSANVWHPGQHVRIVWTPSGSHATGTRVMAPVRLTAVLTGPYRTIVAAAPVIKLSVVPASSPVSVVTIPPGTPPGSYNISFSVASEGASVSGGTIITVG